MYILFYLLCRKGGKWAAMLSPAVFVSTHKSELELIAVVSSIAVEDVGAGGAQGWGENVSLHNFDLFFIFNYVNICSFQKLEK